MIGSRQVQTIVFSFSAVWAVASALSFSQTITSGDLTGTITDSSGAVVPKATVTILSMDTGTSNTVQSAGDGGYRFNFVRPGAYQLSSVGTGLKSDISRINVMVGQVTTVDLVMRVEEFKQAIMIDEETPIVQTDNANLTTTFTSQQVALLPAPGGDLTTVAFTVPGITVNTGGGYGNFSSHGLPGTSNLFTINGNDHTEPYLSVHDTGASNLLLGQNEVAEVAVVQNGYSVQYGRNAGAQIDYITKSGSNEYHGTLVYNWNGTIMNANDFFNNLNGLPKAHAVSNSYSASLGGKIIKNKLFFFADTEGIRYTLPTGGVVTFLSPQFQSYILSTVAPSALSLYNSAFSEYSGVLSKASPVTTGLGPTQDSSGNLGCGASFAGTPDLSGSGVFGVNLPCAYAYATNASNTNEEWLMTYRVDWNINDKNKIYLRFKTDHGLQPSDTNLVTPKYNVQSNQPEYEGQINLTSTISPTMVNSFIGSVLWYGAVFTSPNLQQVVKSLPINLYINEGGSNAGGWYGFGFGVQGAGYNSFPQGRNLGQLGLVDDLSKVWGKHTVKAGVNFRKDDITDFSLMVGTYGTYSFNSVADFAAGVTNPNTGSLYYQNFAPAQAAHLYLYNVGFYLQDEWRVKDNLKITYGARFERTGDPTCKEDCFQNLTSPFTSSAFSKNINTPYGQSIVSGLSHAFPAVNAILPLPRVGVAWKPLHGNNSPIIRAGFGLFADLPPGVLLYNVFDQPPYVFSGVIFDGSPVGLASTPGTSAAAALAQYNAFKTGYAAGDTLAQLNNSVPGGFAPINFFSVPSRLSSPEYAEWSFEVEQPITRKNVLALTYSGNHGYNLFLMNPFANTSVNTANFPNGFGGLPVTAPDGRFSAVTELTNSGISNYDGLTVQFRRALGAGFQGQVGYTWSHALDDLSGLLPFTGNSITGLLTPYPRLNYSNSDFDIRRSLVADFLWETHWKPSNRALSYLLRSWTWSGKFYVRSGLPFSVIDSLLAGEISPAIGGNAITATAAVSNIPTHCGSGAVSTPCFPVSDFVAQGSETNWGITRNSFYGPGYFDVDTALYKNFEIHEGVRLAVGFQGYNILNHPNFGNPSGYIATPGLGQIYATAGAPTSPYGSFQGSVVNGRVMTLSGRFTF